MGRVSSETTREVMSRFQEKYVNHIFESKGGILFLKLDLKYPEKYIFIHIFHRVDSHQTD